MRLVSLRSLRDNTQARVGTVPQSYGLCTKTHGIYVCFELVAGLLHASPEAKAMRKVLYIVAISALSLPAVAAEHKVPPTPQIQRGMELFTNSKKGVACKTCHSLGGLGTAIGPDLTNMATNGSVHAIAMTMHMTMTEYVRRVQTRVNSFPAMLKEKKGDQVTYWDLNEIPPVARTFSSTEIASVDRDEKWKHPPAMAKYTAQELADVISFLKWTTTGAEKEIAPDEVGIGK
jgi:mono/diheme cytochrome c family protein